MERLGGLLIKMVISLILGLHLLFFALVLIMQKFPFGLRIVFMISFHLFAVNVFIPMVFMEKVMNCFQVAFKFGVLGT